MSDKLYYSDGYLRETEATVISVSDRGIKLDRTVFYPEAEQVEKARKVIHRKYKLYKSLEKEQVYEEFVG